MKKLIIHPLTSKINTEVTVPGCIGYTIRAMNIAAMTKGVVKIQNPLKSDDTYTMLNALNEMGINTEEGRDYFKIGGDISEIKKKEYKINIGISGRTARTILALLCVSPGTKIITCDDQFKKRPVADLVDGLTQLGAIIEYLEEPGFLPVKITSETLNSGSITMRGNLSSQYFSAIMMIAPIVGEITINVAGKQSSKPFIDMTIDIMKCFNVYADNRNYKKYYIKSGQHYSNPQTYFVEPEATSASYFFAIAAITASKIRILNLSPNSLQGDLRFVDILGKMGCKVKKNTKENWIEVEGTSHLKGVKINMNSTPDIVGTLAVVASFAVGKTEIVDIEHIRIKETDRIESPKTELKKMGIKSNSTKDTLVIEGGAPLGATINTYGDHRMAMSFAIAGAKIPGVIIIDPDVVSKSFPDFWKKLETIGIRTEEVL